MWKIPVNLTILALICAILNIKLTNSQLINSEESIGPNLPDLIPNEDDTTNSNETSHITITSIDDEVPISKNTPTSTTQSNDNQDHISTNDITEITETTIEYNIKHEISNPPFIPAIESRLIPIIRPENTNPPLIPAVPTRIIPPEMEEYIAKIQKCCPPEQIMLLGQPGEQSTCIESTEVFNLPVFYANLTHYWNYTTTAGNNVEIIFRDPCKKSSKYYMDPTDETDTFRLLYNSSLYIPFNMDMLNTDQYCVDTIQGSESTFATALICTAPPKTDIFHYFFIAGIFISMICLIALAIYSMHRKDIKEDHKKCLAFYGGTMATAYLFIAISTIFYNDLNFYFSVTFAYIIYYLKLKYYLWLNMLCFDTYRCIRDKTIDTISYMKWYLMATFIIPFIFVLFTFIDNFKPALPNLYMEYSFSSSKAFIISLYIVPVFISTVCNIILICLTPLPKDRYDNKKDLFTALQKDWILPLSKEIKTMRRRSLILFIFIFIFFLLDIVIYCVPSTGKQQPHFIVRDVVYCLQGFFISCIFVRKEWLPKSSRRYRSTGDQTSDRELQPINGTL